MSAVSTVDVFVAVDVMTIWFLVDTAAVPRLLVTSITVVGTARSKRTQHVPRLFLITSRLDPTTFHPRCRFQLPTHRANHMGPDHTDSKISTIESAHEPVAIVANRLHVKVAPGASVTVMVPLTEYADE